jgi:hypothetical protein
MTCLISTCPKSPSNQAWLDSNNILAFVKPALPLPPSSTLEGGGDIIQVQEILPRPAMLALLPMCRTNEDMAYGRWVNRSDVKCAYEVAPRNLAP